MSGGTSYNGWPCSSNPADIDVQHFGDSYGYPFPGGVRAGDVATVLGYVATQLHARVEPCVAGWDWGYEYRENVNNPGEMSCHASATAIDWNAPDHPNGSRGTYSSAQVAQIRQILDEVGGAVQWGGDYTGTADEMHFEIIVDASYLAQVAANLPGGGPVPPQPQPKDEDGMTASVTVNGSLNVFAVADDDRIYQQWPAPGTPSGWSGWQAGIPGTWKGGLSVTAGADGGFSLFGVDTEGQVCQVWTTAEGWMGPVPFTGITAGG